jgi:hypothetical protein
MKRLVILAALTVAAAHAHDRGASNPVLEWNEIMVDAVAELPPPDMNRFATIVHLAMFDAVNSVTREYEPYLGMLPASPGASAEAAAISAAHHVLRGYFPERAPALDAARMRALARVPEGPGKESGIALGTAAATALMDARRDDGAEPAAFHLPSSTRPGEWQLTPDCSAAGGLFAHWSRVQPFALLRADQFRSEPPPALVSERYARSYEEIRDVGARESARRSRDRTEVAWLYAATGDAVLWNPVARQMARAHRRSLTHDARVFALLNIALNEGGIAVMDTKYHYEFWRPETAIVAGAADGNPKTEPDGGFVPFIAAPCFPSYPSGHASTSYGAREILERVYGTRGHRIVVSSPALPGIRREYSTLAQITADIDDARVYGGIHFRFDQEAGAKQGRQVGEYVFGHVLRPGPEVGAGVKNQGPAPASELSARTGP